MAPATIAVDLAGCMPALGRHRYLEVSFRLASTMTGVRPRLDEADASWAY